MFRYTGGRRDWFAAGLGQVGKEAKHLRASMVVRRDVPTCRLDERLGDVRARVGADPSAVCVVVDESGVVVGRLREPAWSADATLRVEQAMDTPSTYRADAPLDWLLELARGKPGIQFVITDPDGTLIGLVDPEDARRARSRRRRSRSPARASRAGRTACRARTKRRS